MHYQCSSCDKEFRTYNTPEALECKRLGHLVVRMLDESDVEAKPLRTIRSLSSNDEGKEIMIDCMVATTDVFKTVTIKANFKCLRCKKIEEVFGNGYENPKEKWCSECRVKMIMGTESKVTNDLMDIVLEEFLEESENNRPIYYDSKVFGKDVKTVFDGQRKRVKCVYKSVESKDGKTNIPILLVDEIQDLDEPDTVKLTEEEIDKLTKQAKEDPLYFKKLINSFAGHIEGNYDSIKELIIMALAGGSEGITRRTEIHVLMVGDPGKGKSEMIKCATKSIHKGRYIIGFNTSKAGLGSGMVKMANGTSQPRSGVLILYSGGLVGADELDKMHEDDRKSLLESMEQGTVTLIKNGVEQERVAKTTILAGCNPKYGEYDWDESPFENINMESYLIQRFDFIWNITQHSESDMQLIAKKVLGLETQTKEKLFDELGLKKFINTVRPLKPTIRDSAKHMIMEYFLKVSKRTDNKKTLPMDVRQLEGLIRATTSRAKLQFKQEADESDVQEVIRLHKESLLTFGIDTHGDVQQMKLVERALTREQKIYHVLNDVLDAKGEFVEFEYLNVLMDQQLFKSPESCKKWFNSQIGEKFLMCGNGKYRKSGT